MADKEERFPKVTPDTHASSSDPGNWIYEDYVTPPDKQRYETIDGVSYGAPPTHTVLHQQIIACMIYYFYSYVTLKGLGNVLSGPVDVELARQTIVQPDLLILLGGLPGKFLVSSHVIGAPDLVVEILEQDTTEHDRGKKYNAYARGGVREYWIVDPLVGSVEIYALEASIYHLLGIFRGEDLLPSWVIKDFPVRVNQFFI